MTLSTASVNAIVVHLDISRPPLVSPGANDAIPIHRTPYRTAAPGIAALAASANK
jgi:hypothetical protein